MKVLGIDYGTKNIGLALSDDTQKLAFAYNTLNKKSLLIELKDICNKEEVEKIIVGLPIGLSGEDTQTTELVLSFVKELEKELNIPIQTLDERLSTVQASRMENKNVHPVKSATKSRSAKQFSRASIDELSAQIFLQAYLDKNNV
ncbi:MAG: Holliday junction resolvase RuvX [Patescibacteria group bacterium]